jgi:hypothetical protein
MEGCAFNYDFGVVFLKKIHILVKTFRSKIFMEIFPSLIPLRKFFFSTNISGNNFDENFSKVTIFEEMILQQ